MINKRMWVVESTYGVIGKPIYKSRDLAKFSSKNCFKMAMFFCKLRLIFIVAAQ